MNETAFTKIVTKKLQESGFYVEKRFGSATATKGLPDLMVVNKHLMHFNLEIKHGSKLSPIQRLRLKQVPNGSVISTVIEIDRFIKENKDTKPKNDEVQLEYCEIRTTSERSITTKVITHLRKQGVYCERRANIALGGVNGKADFLCVMPSGYHFEIEFKSSIGKPSQNQLTYIAQSMYNVFILGNTEDYKGVTNVINKRCIR